MLTSYLGEIYNKPHSDAGSEMQLQDADANADTDTFTSNR